MNEDQKKNIDVAVVHGQGIWLANLIHGVFNEKTIGNRSSVFDKKCSRLEMLCEIADRMVHYDAHATFTNTIVRYAGACKIANLPTYDGQYILDAAEFQGRAPSLAAAIRASGGRSFPVILSTENSRTTFFEWRKLTTAQEKTSYLKMLYAEKADLGMTVNCYNDYVLAVAADVMLAGNPAIADRLMNKLHWAELDDFNLRNATALRDLATQREAFETAAYLKLALEQHNDRKASRPEKPFTPPSQEIKLLPPPPEVQ